MKTTEELNTMKEEVEAMSRKLRELTGSQRGRFSMAVS